MTHELWSDTRTGGYGHGSDGRGGGWPGLAQVICVRITRRHLTRDFPDTIEDHYYLTSLAPEDPRGSPAALLKRIRTHWEIENRLHHVKDRSMGEDADRSAPGAVTLARLRSLAVGLLPYVPGDSAPLKQINAAADISALIRLLKRKTFPKTPRSDF